MATTVVEVWRNKAREKAVARAAQAGEALPEKYQPVGADGMDTMLLVHKQNATGKEPAIRLWFDQDSTQFLGQANHRPRPMVSFSIATPRQPQSSAVSATSEASRPGA